MKVCRRSNFNAAHRLFRPDWSDEKNQTVFGKCNNPNFHGHNYTLEVWIDGEIDQERRQQVRTTWSFRKRIAD